MRFFTSNFLLLRIMVISFCIHYRFITFNVTQAVNAYVITRQLWVQQKIWHYCNEIMDKQCKSCIQRLCSTVAKLITEQRSLNIVPNTLFSVEVAVIIPSRFICVHYLLSRYLSASLFLQSFFCFFRKVCLKNNNAG